MSRDNPTDEEPPRTWLGRFTQLFSSEPESIQDLLEILRDAEQRNLLSFEALGIIEGALQVFDMQVREIMVPRSRMTVVRADQPPEEFMAMIVESGHSRFPVLGDNPDEVEGILLAKDMLPYTSSSAGLERFELRDVLRPATFVPESKRLNVLLREFRSTRNHIAIVIDEYGGVAGLVTIEDVLEQIVGEIADEYDVEDEDSFISRFDDGQYTVKALTPVDEFNRHFEANLNNTEFETVGGVVMSRFGHLPKRNETIEIDGFRFRVLNADSRRIRLLRVTPRH